MGQLVLNPIEMSAGLPYFQGLTTAQQYVKP